MQEYQNDWKTCEYCELSYAEYDTGYKEYSCELLGCECMDEDICPLSFKYEVEKNDVKIS